MRKILPVVFSMMLLFTVGCTKQLKTQNVDDSKQIIKVNDGFITIKEFDKAFDEQTKNGMGKYLKGSETKDNLLYLIFKDRIINELVIKELLDQEIEKRNINVSNSDVNKSIDEIAEKLGGKSKLEAKLALLKISKDDLKKGLKRDLEMNKLIGGLAVTSVSNNDVKKFYDENKSTKFTNPDLVRAQHILISVSEDDLKTKIEAENSKLSKEAVSAKIEEEVAKAKKKAENILVEVKNKPDEFGKLASRYSEDSSSAKKDGDLGFFAQKDMVKEFADAAFSQKPDTISDLVKTQFGYHIIKVTDRKKAGVTPFKEVEPEIKKYLEETNKTKVVQNFIEGIKNSAKIEYLDKSYDPSGVQNEIKKLAQSQKPLEQKDKK